MESRFQTEETSEQEPIRLSAVTAIPTPQSSSGSGAELTQGDSTHNDTDATQTQLATDQRATSDHTDRTGYEVLRRLKKQAGTRWILSWILALVIVLTNFLPQLFPFFTGAVAAITTFVVYSAMLLIYLAAWNDIQRTRQDLERIDDLNMVGPLAEALDAERYMKPKPIIAALRRLLPRMQHSDAKKLTSAQRACLYRALYRHRSRSRWIFDKELALDILKSMQQIGDREAISHVKRVATWAGDARLRHAANDCLPFLMAKQEEFNRSQTYLRPSSATEMGTDSLLRASIEESPTHPEELLRATDATTHRSE